MNLPAIYTSINMQLERELQLYVLKLNSDKYYVGETDNIESTFCTHQNGAHGDWTCHYGTQGIIELKTIQYPYDMRMKTIEYMLEHGIDNVRSDKFQQRDLSKYDKENLTRIIQAWKNPLPVCSKCGGKL